MPMTDELARRATARGEAHPIHHVVETALERREQVVPGDARRRAHALERVAELLLAQLIDALDLLLLAQLLGVLRRLAAARSVLAVLAGRVWTTLHRTLLGEALGALQKEL